MIADLHIHDRDLINAIQNGKREISCGYECDYVQNGDGTYSQKKIRGNHVAVVERGRAGKRAAILDSDKKEEAKKPERKVMKKGFLFKIFGQAVKDKSAEEIEQLAMDAAAALDEGTHEPESGTKQPEVGQQNTEETKPALDAAFYVALDQKVDKILKALDEKTTTEKNEEKDPMDEAIKTLEGTKDEDPEENEKQEEAKVVPAEEMDETSEGMDKAVAASILKAMRPTVAAIQDAAQRKAVSDALIKAVTARDTANDIDAILKASRANAKKAADAKPAMTVEQCQAAYDARNPHKRKENQ